MRWPVRAGSTERPVERARRRGSAADLPEPRPSDVAGNCPEWRVDASEAGMSEARAREPTCFARAIAPYEREEPRATT